MADDFFLVNKVTCGEGDEHSTLTEKKGEKDILSRSFGINTHAGNDVGKSAINSASLVVTHYI